MSAADFKVKNNVQALGVGLSVFQGSIQALLGFTGNLTGNADTATKLATARAISISGDATGTANFDGSAGISIAATFANSGVTAGTYGSSSVVPSITVDAKGRVTAVTNNTITPASIGAIASSQLGVASGVATLDAGGKLTTAQIPSALVGALQYQGVWNAATNSPAIANGVGTKGFYYKVSVAGNTTIDGNNNWTIGDLVVFDGTTWDKVEGGSPDVSSVNGQVGAVNITTITGNAGTATTLQTARNIALTGDGTGTASFNGSADASIALTLSASGVTAGSGYNTFTVDAKGRVTAASTTAYLTANQNITLSGDATGSGTSAIAVTLAASGVTAGTYGSATAVPAITVDAKGRVTGVVSTNIALSAASVNTSLFGAVSSASSASPVATATAGTYNVASFATASYRSAKLVVQITQGTVYEVLELLILHDGTNAFVNEYGRVSIGASGVSFDASITAGSCNVTYTQPAISTTIKATVSLIAI